jgi:hypothetical protein
MEYCVKVNFIHVYVQFFILHLSTCHYICNTFSQIIDFTKVFAEN